MRLSAKLAFALELTDGSGQVTMPGAPDAVSFERGRTPSA
jgi:hypothetical protein